MLFLDVADIEDISLASQLLGSWSPSAGKFVQDKTLSRFINTLADQPSASPQELCLHRVSAETHLASVAHPLTDLGTVGQDSDIAPQTNGVGIASFEDPATQHSLLARLTRPNCLNEFKHIMQ